MVGAPKAPAGRFGITSLPRTTVAETTTPTAPTTGTPVEQTKSTGRDNNPVLRSLRTDCFEGHGVQGKGLALGHLKRAARAEKPTEAKPQEALQKLVDNFKKLLEQLLAQLGQQTQPQPAPVPGNTGIVPPGAVTPGNTGIVPPGV
ncbi:MAG TPA: hypothetical protein VE057_15630 [Archangium sp.]|nr:hypothetical protein [Archangium sp.]